MAFDIPQAVGDLANNLVDGATNLIEDVAKDATDLFGDIVDSIEDEIDKASSFFESKLGGAAGFLTDLVNTVGIGGTLTLGGLGGSIVSGPQAFAFDLPDPTDPELLTPREQFNNSMLNGDKETATKIISKYSEAPPEDIKLILELTTATRAGTLLIDSSSLSLPPSFPIGSTFGTENPEYFSFVSSREELEAEMRSIPRPISEVVVHWTETYTNANMDADQIRDMAIANGSSAIPYHYVIKRDGSLQRGFPVSKESKHCDTLNHNQYSISVVFVGGLNVSTGTLDVDEFTQSSSLTRSQFNTFNEMMKVFYDVYPGGQVLGHKDIDVTQQDPGFDVIDYCESVFGKPTLYLDPAIETALSPSDIISRQRESNLSLVTLNKVENI